jgi:hypothetical protein
MLRQSMDKIDVFVHCLAVLVFLEDAFTVGVVAGSVWRWGGYLLATLSRSAFCSGFSGGGGQCLVTQRSMCRLVFVLQCRCVCEERRALCFSVGLCFAVL